ncbi:MAG: hypothetical protein KKC20_22925 [Proteobacteria bacterium]|nr:hypothetical protein [Pseudomonadota bacterium]
MELQTQNVKTDKGFKMDKSWTRSPTRSMDEAKMIIGEDGSRMKDWGESGQAEPRNTELKPLGNQKPQTINQ